MKTMNEVFRLRLGVGLLCVVPLFGVGCEGSVEFVEDLDSVESERAGPAPGLGDVGSAGETDNGDGLSDMDESGPAPVTFDESAESGIVVYALDVGGESANSIDGILYEPDEQYANGGSTYAVNREIRGTLAQQPFRSERYGDFRYDLPVENGRYEVTLGFAELFFTAPGERVFDVAMERRRVLENFDIYAAVGGDAAHEVTLETDVVDGQLSIAFISQVGSAKVNVIRVLAVPGQGEVPNPPPGETIPAPESMKLVWSPSDQEVAAATSTDRVRYTTDAPGGGSAIEFSYSASDGRSIAGWAPDIPGARESRPQSARACVQMYFPTSTSCFNPSGSGKLALGLEVDTGQEVSPGRAGNGGTAPYYQNSVSVRLQRFSCSDGTRCTPVIYSYHLNRYRSDLRGAPSSCSPPSGNAAVLNQECYNPGLNSFLDMKYPANEWLTACIDVNVNTFDGNGEPIADGSAIASIYDSNGDLIGRGGQEDAVFARDSSGYVSSLFSSEMWNRADRNRPTCPSRYYYRNYQVFLPDSND